MRRAHGLAALALAALAAASAPARADDGTKELERVYHDSRDDDARRRALAALGERKSPEAEKVLAQALAQDPSEPVRLEAVAALLKHGDEPAARALIEAVNGFDPYVTEAVVAGLSRAMPDKFRRWLLDSGLSHEKPEVRAASVRILAATRAPELGAKLSKLANDATPEVREAVAIALAKLDAKTVLPLAERLAKDSEVKVRVAAIAAAAPCEGEKAEKLLAAAAESDKAWQARAEAIRVLGERGPRRWVEVLLKALKDAKGDRHVRLAALEALSSLREAVVADALVALATDGGERFDLDVRRVLGSLLGQELGTAAETKAWWKEHRAGFRFPEPRPASEASAHPELKTRARFFDLPIDSLRPCFVLDISGSMSEPMTVGSATVSARSAALATKISVARAELEKALAALPKDASFGVILFADRTIPIQDQPVLATKESVAKALAEVAKYEPQGSTNLYSALSNLLHGSAPRDPQAADQVAFDAFYLLSDGLPTSGAVTETEALRARVREWNRFARVRIHAVGIGDENRALLEGIAHDAGGMYLQK